ncbi:MAG: hypothetical protein WD648_15950 [Planctomycetaceae bacterium]
MADERKRSRWPIVVVALLVLYPLGMGPMARIERRAMYHGMDSVVTAIQLVYFPLILLRRVPAFERIYLPYLALWVDLDADAVDRRLNR